MSDCTPALPGTFCWAELATSDVEAAQGFYAELFGWTTKESPMGDGGVYTHFRKDDQDVGGCYKLMPEQEERGVPPHWLNYVRVDDTDAMAVRATELGGTVALPPMTIPETGRMAVILDPGGASFALWQPLSEHGQPAPGPGTVAWTELMTRDADTVCAFYSALFGWTRQVKDVGMGPYNMMMNGDQQAAGIMQMGAEFPAEVPSHWMTYFATEDCDGGVERVTANGGSVCVPPTDIPSVGRFAVITDPQGATSSIIKFTPDCS
jgi:predicted enzyme related to lactoylglutathione lyase